MLEDPLLLLIALPAILIALTVHEYAHGRAALALGDPTASYMGRLSLNPIKQIDPFGALMMLVVGFGWAKPVPVNPRYFKNPKKGMAITALMGPLTNFALAFLCVPLYLLAYKIGQFLVSVSGASHLLAFFEGLLAFLFVLHTLNLSLALFNLIPLPPLDGSRILGLFLPSKLYYRVLRHERQIYFAVLIWLLVGSRICEYLLTLPAIFASPFLTFFVKLISVTGFLSDAVSFLSDIFFKLFYLIPFLSI